MRKFHKPALVPEQVWQLPYQLSPKKVLLKQTLHKIAQMTYFYLSLSFEINFSTTVNQAFHLYHIEIFNHHFYNLCIFYLQELKDCNGRVFVDSCPEFCPPEVKGVSCFIKFLSYLVVNLNLNFMFTLQKYVLEYDRVKNFT